MLDHQAVERWLDAYVEAWRSYDPDQIGALFTEDATCLYRPWDEGDAMVRGRQAIIDSWRDDQDQPGAWEASYEPLVIEGDRAVATGLTRYRNGKTYWNMFVLDFSPTGLCQAFVEWFMEQPADVPPERMDPAR